MKVLNFLSYIILIIGYVIADYRLDVATLFVATGTIFFILSELELHHV